MAILTLKPGAALTARKHGIVGYPITTTTGGFSPVTHTVNVLRTGPAPVQPLSFIQNKSQNLMSYVAWWWANMTPTEQALWTGIAKPGNTPYANFVQFNLPTVYNGTTPWTGYPGYAGPYDAVGVFAISNPSVGPDYIRVVYIDSPGSPATVNLSVYLAPSPMTVQTFCRLSSNTPGLPTPFPNIATPAYAFYGVLQGLTKLVYYDIPWPGGFGSIIGTAAYPVVDDASTLTSVGNYLALKVYLSTPGGVPLWTQAYGPPPSYTPYRASLPYLCGSYFSSAPPTLASGSPVVPIASPGAVTFTNLAR